MLRSWQLLHIMCDGISDMVTQQNGTVTRRATASTPSLMAAWQPHAPKLKQPQQAAVSQQS
jgi:hypothetical protein